MGKIGKAVPPDNQGQNVEDLLAWHAIVNSALSELSNSLISGTYSLEEMASLFLEHALGLTGSHSGCISLIPFSGEIPEDIVSLPLSCRFSIAGTQQEVVIRKGKDGRYPGLWGHVLNTGKAFYTNSPQGREGEESYPFETGENGKTPLRCFLSVPFLDNGELLGHLAVADSPEPYIHRDLEAVERLAALFVLAVRHFRSREELKSYRKRLEERVEERTAELKALNQRYRALLDAMPDIMFNLDINGTFLDFKGAGEETIIPENQIAGTNVFDLPVSDQIKTEFTDKIRAAVESGESQTHEYYLEKSTGIHHYEARIVKCGPEEVVCWVRNITKRKQYEERLLFTQYSVDHMGEAAFWLDSEGRVIYVNEAACRSLKYTREELLTMSVFQIDPKITLEKWNRQWDKMKAQDSQGKARIFESFQRRKDGSEFPVEINANLVFFEGQEYNCAFVRDISARKQAQDTLREERDFNKTLIDTSPTFFVAIDIKGKTRMMNPAMLDKLGYTAEEVVGTDYLTTFVPENEREIMKDIFGHLSHEEGNTYNENHVITRDGNKLLVEWHGRPVFASNGVLDYFFGVGIDITERHKAEEARRESEERFRQLAELLPVSVYEADLEGRVTYANLAAYKTFKYLHEDLENGVSLIDLISPPERQQAKQNIPKIIAGQYSGGTEYTAICKDGSTFPMITYSNAIIKKKRPVGIRGIVVDITERKKAVEQEQHYQLQLMQADKMISLGTLVAGVAHEINNPNNAIMFNIPLLREIFKEMLPSIKSGYKDYPDLEIGGLPFSEIEESVTRLFDGMVRSSERINNIVADLKNFARPGHYEMDQDVHINDVVKTSVTLLNNMINKSTRKFSTQYGDKIPVIKGNFQRLEQVVINLIQNACQALTSKDNAIHVSTAVYRDKKEKNKVVRIRVKDEGCGIPEGNLKFITDPFYTTKRSQGGTGLGLSITSRIIKDHHGHLEIDSKPGEGSMFIVTIPVNGTRAKTPGKK